MRREVIGGCELTCEDCMELMARYPDKYFDLAIVDPPYGIGVNHNMGRRKGDMPSQYKKVEWDTLPPPAAYFVELMRVSLYQIIWGANHFISLIPFNSSCWIVWDKLFSENVSFASVELAWTNFQNVCKRIQLSSLSQNNRIHPTQKPVALYKWLLSKYAKPDWKILDTHLGSGSSAIACYDMGFPLTACEIDEDYFAAAVERLRLFAAQGTLDFGGEA